jgi:hypothetical protein
MAVLKGAFIDTSAGLLGVLPNIVVFQFNPETLTRTPKMVQTPVTPSGEGRQDSYLQIEEPTESINFTLRIDATDQLLLEHSPIAALRGILPTLSALELLMKPRPPVDLSQLAQLAAPGAAPGPYRPKPLILPAILFVWGLYRILPVTITGLSINETEFDVLLNPVRAEVTVDLDVLTPSQLGTSSDTNIARHAHDYSWKVKAAMAALNLANAAEIGLQDIRSFF